jgi:hypothetical protein
MQRWCLWDSWFKSLKVGSKHGDTCNPSTRKTEARGRPEDDDFKASVSYSEFELSLGYIVRSVSKTKTPHVLETFSWSET